MSMEIHENRNLYKTDYANQLKAKPKEDKETEKTQNESKASDQSTAIQDEKDNDTYRRQHASVSE